MNILQKVVQVVQENMAMRRHSHQMTCQWPTGLKVIASHKNNMHHPTTYISMHKTTQEKVIISL
jgi:hypothetical protein